MSAITTCRMTPTRTLLVYPGVSKTFWSFADVPSFVGRKVLMPARAREASPVVVLQGSASSFPDESFDVVWAEGVLHLLDPFRSVPACHRLLKAGGLLVIGETVAWFEAGRERLGAFGFRLVDQRLLPRHSWWTEFYAPLEARIRALRQDHGDAVHAEELARYEHEVAMVKADSGRFDCGFLLAEKDLGPLVG